MNAQELRIGNWVVRNSSGTYQQVKEVFTTGVLLQNEPPLDIRKSMRLPLSAISPIPLTPEIISDLMKGNLKEISIEYKGGVWLFGKDAVHCKHLHQLQNLYYSLTGDELKIEL